MLAPCTRAPGRSASWPCTSGGTNSGMWLPISPCPASRPWRIRRHGLQHLRVPPRRVRGPEPLEQVRLDVLAVARLARAVLASLPAHAPQGHARRRLEVPPHGGRRAPLRPRDRPRRALDGMPPTPSADGMVAGACGSGQAALHRCRRTASAIQGPRPLPGAGKGQA